MSQTYSVTGINLKSMALGESDRLLTILTPEQGVLRAVATGARKQNSRLGGRTALFVVNHYLIAKGRSLDKVLQAETHLSFTGLSRDLGRLTAAQYLAELTLLQAIEGHPQAELFMTLQKGLQSLESCMASLVLPHLIHQMFQFLTLAGLAPEVQCCCKTRRPIVVDWNRPDWFVEFSQQAGGLIFPQSLDHPESPPSLARSSRPPRTVIYPRLSALEVTLLQQLHLSSFSDVNSSTPVEFDWESPSERVMQAWMKLEMVLRAYVQYHFEQPLRSAELIQSCWTIPALAQPGGSRL